MKKEIKILTIISFSLFTLGFICWMILSQTNGEVIIKNGCMHPSFKSLEWACLLFPFFYSAAEIVLIILLFVIFRNWRNKE